jgi:hypothetical protein
VDKENKNDLTHIKNLKSLKGYRNLQRSILDINDEKLEEKWVQ